MHSRKNNSQDTLVQSLWSAIVQGTRLRHVGDNDPRVFILKSILWGREACRVINVDTGEATLFPWTEPSVPGRDRNESGVISTDSENHIEAINQDLHFRVRTTTRAMMDLLPGSLHPRQRQ